jgi:signal transduction histidine kinase
MRRLKFLSIVVLIGLISAVHLLYSGSHLGLHVLHQQLYYIPLVLASFWFGIRTGLTTAIVVSLLYGPTMLLRQHEPSMHLTVLTQIALYLVVALLIGWLSDRHRRQERELLQNERVTALGKAASNLGLEIGDIVRGLESIYRQAGGLKESSVDASFQNEFQRLKEMAEVLRHYTAVTDRLPSSTDLNDVLRHVLGKYRKRAEAKGVKMTVKSSERGSPSTAPVESISRVYERLVENAIEFSLDGQTINLRSGGDEKEYILEVADEGPGVAKEHEKKLFTAFFTTRADGYGLSLASGRKLLRDLGGELTYRRGENGGAVFSIHVPR